MWRKLGVCFVILCVCRVDGLTVDSQFGTSSEDCFERFLIGWQLPQRVIYRNATELTARECEKLCRRDKQCRSYDYGVGAKGNATCNLSDVTEKDITENKIAQKNTDYDIHIRHFRCEQPPPKPLKPNFNDLIDDPEKKPITDLENDQGHLDNVQGHSERPSKPQDQKPSPNTYAYHFRPPQNDYINQRPNHKPNYHNDNDRPDAPYPDIAEPDSNIGYGQHKPSDTPFRPNYHNHTKPKPDPYDVLNFQHHYRPSTIHYSENLRPDPPYQGYFEDGGHYGHKPMIDHHYRPEKPLYPDQNYYHKPILPPITHLPEYFPSNQPGYKPSYQLGYKPNWDSHSSSYDQTPEVPSYGSNVRPMKPNYGAHNQNQGGSHYIYLEINETPKPFKKPAYPHISDNYYLKPDSGYHNYQPLNTHKPSQSYGEDDNYYKPTYNKPSYTENIQSYENNYNPSYTDLNYNKPGNKPYYGESGDNAYLKPIKPSHSKPSYSDSGYNKPSYTDSGYNKPSYEQPSYIKPSYGESDDNQYPAQTKPSYNTPSYTGSSYNKPSYQKPSYDKPGYGESGNNEYPTPNKPSYNEPSYTGLGYKPGYEKPSYINPSYGDSGDSEYNAPVKPSYNKPSYISKPSYGESGDNEYNTPVRPTYNKPSYTDSGYNKPSYISQPSYGDSGDNEYSAPVKPSYNKPSYTDFGYNKPSYTDSGYNKPSYTSKPSYGDPSENEYSSSSYQKPDHSKPSYYKPTYHYERPSHYSPFQSYDNHYDSNHQETSNSYDIDKWDYPQKPSYSYNKPENYGHGYNHNLPDNYETEYDKNNHQNGYNNNNNLTGYGYGDKPGYNNKPGYENNLGYNDKPGYAKPDNEVKPVYEKDPYRPANAPSYTIKPSGHVISSGAISVVNQGAYGNKPGSPEKTRNVMTYGADTRSLTMGLVEKLKIAQRAIERGMLGISLREHVKNGDIRQQTKVADIAQRIDKL